MIGFVCCVVAVFLIMKSLGLEISVGRAVGNAVSTVALRKESSSKKRFDFMNGSMSRLPMLLFMICSFLFLIFYPGNGALSRETGLTLRKEPEYRVNSLNSERKRKLGPRSRVAMMHKAFVEAAMKEINQEVQSALENDSNL